MGKVCTKCGQWKVLDEFHKHSRHKDGHNTICKKCSLAAGRARGAANPGYEAARAKVYYQAHRKESGARSRAWEANNREKEALRHRLYRASHKEEIAGAKRRWQLAHPEKGLAAVRRRRARKFKAPGSHIVGEWLALAGQYNACPCCSKLWSECGKPTLDHIVPLSWEGTSDDIRNIQPLCLSCNSAKGNHHATDYRHQGTMVSEASGIRKLIPPRPAISGNASALRLI